MARGTALAGKHALVTGASRGIGRSIAIMFGQEGADVAIVARSAEPLAEVGNAVRATGANCTVIVADVTDPNAAQRLVDESVAGLGSLDILVNNAGGNSFMSALADIRYSGWEKTIELNLNSIVRLMQAAIPVLKRSGNSSIINVASVTGALSSPYMAHYGAAKAALISVTRSTAVELALQGVRVNALVPGWIETDLTGFARENEGVEQSLIDRVPMRRWGTPDEIAHAAVFLAGDASSFMTGQSLVIDGGLLANP
jgi:NAD(P)-dependent dehydrogenase (short-subunit alcohol dehydrogenase family)